MSLRPTPLLRAYGVLADLIAPLAYARVRAKLTRGGVAPARLSERMGRATLSRPAGRLVWFHAASVGESLSVLTLITRMGASDPDLQFLITSGTATSAEILSRRLPPCCRHQFAPLDSRPALRRFLAHWRPSLAVFVESELWPQMLVQTRKSGVPMALLNARLSATSARNWRRVPDTSRLLISLFSMIRTQTRDTFQTLSDLGADPGKLAHGPNLKAASDPLPCDPATLAQLRTATGPRPLWVAASTHPGEEEIILAAHRAALATAPDLLLLLVPRHPERGDTVEALIRAAGLGVTRRSRGQAPEPGAQVYLADTVGETGLWYGLSPIVFLGGSLGDAGGHNPYEPARAGAAIIAGPKVANFAETYGEFDAAGAVLRVTGAGDLAACLTDLLADPGRLETLRRTTRDFAETQAAGLDGLIKTLSALVTPV